MQKCWIFYFAYIRRAFLQNVLWFLSVSDNSLEVGKKSWWNFLIIHEIRTIFWSSKKNSGNFDFFSVFHKGELKILCISKCKGFWVHPYEKHEKKFELQKIVLISWIIKKFHQDFFPTSRELSETLKNRKTFCKKALRIYAK